MSTPRLFSRSARAGAPTLPRGEVLGTYDTYPEAQTVVDRLAKAEFPVKQVSIVGSGLRTVERVTGKLTYAKAAGAGAASGAWFGLFIGALLFLFTATPSLAVLGAAVFIGAGFGMIFNLTTYSVGRRRRDFTSVHQVLASHYEIIVEPASLGRAKEILAEPVAD